MRELGHAHGRIALDHCLVMGIVNRTPDSFYDGGRMGLEESVSFALGMVEEGAEILDLGAVKAGPGTEVSEEEELARLVPLVEEIARRTDVPLSIETSRPSVVAAAVEAGAGIVNDVTGLSDPDMGSVVAATGAGLVVMHNGGQVRGRPRRPRYEDVVADVISSWSRSIAEVTDAGVSRENIVVDAGLDFGKTTYHSLELVRRLDEQVALGLPLLVAASRKDMVGESLSLPLEERLEGSLAVAVLAAHAGAAIVRVHDVRETSRAVRMAEAVGGLRSPSSPVRGLWD